MSKVFLLGSERFKCRLALKQAETNIIRDEESRAVKVTHDEI
jgi:hypothetical protein